LDALAAATGRSTRGLSYALPELRPGLDPAAAVHVRRTVCWRCAARHSAFRFAVTWPHPVWLGPPVRTVHGLQHDVGDAPIIRAQQRHRRLARHRGRRAAALAFAGAAPITALWARHGFHRDRRVRLVSAITGRHPLTGRLQPGDLITPVVTYPETVDLARVLAMLA